MDIFLIQKIISFKFRSYRWTYICWGRDLLCLGCSSPSLQVFMGVSATKLKTSTVTTNNVAYCLFYFRYCDPNFYKYYLTFANFIIFLSCNGLSNPCCRYSNSHTTIHVRFETPKLYISCSFGFHIHCTCYSYRIHYCLNLLALLHRYLLTSFFCWPP